MKNERLLDAFGQIEEELIDEAHPEKIEINIKKKNNHSWMKWVGITACFVIVAGASASIYMSKNQAVEMADEMSMMEEEVDFTSEVTDSPNIENDWGITLAVKDVTPTGLVLVITQSGGKPTGELEYGSDYHLAVLEDGDWTDVPYVVDGDVAWTSEAYIVQMEDSTELEISWEWLYGNLSSGTYRISKGFMDFRGPGDYDNQSLYAEFMIE